ncbi:PREDICTED: two-component response regulator-like APRR7 [Tarenaya hassleriana]|uniref:two-component response regulator-like APRR7 n=1 Tax=Tarenaya hassleriana TaxID=28532 RepID=UPI00053C48A0|nr:PREDICTED: two-component response regulator-like APRR7 [Tarenaya hassleriana]XP_010543356.1 PREDICTED: two-component response regulator-like APRR7 [Tarenaya hassleriana]XP_010543357.1 PREDICTED: two-component response regulator-like APRR7 [Tarenaya hassleriana]
MNVDGDGKDRHGMNHQMHGGKTRETMYDRFEIQAGRQHEDDKVNDDARDGSLGAVGASAAIQIPHTQHQTAETVCWERFLHVRSIRVLLVENDDSTRHVVTALLRNCSYEVVEAANGIQALKILADMNNHIDIVLTEVVMPYLSGIGLLCKILSHKTRRNIPVIMMSSHDSMGVVFKCLSKGAVDFLVKPIRKNELKNLWQHVWRRCHSSSGSGSESGTQTQKSVKSKSVENSGNDSGSNDENENGINGLNVCDGSSDGSGIQSSWTKQAVEVDSPRPESPRDRADSTCAQVIHSNAEGPITQLVAAAHADKEPQKQDDNLDVTMRIDIDPQLEPKDEALIRIAGNKRQDNQLERSSSKWKMKVRKGPLDLNSESPLSKPMHGDGSSGFIAKSRHLQDNQDPEAPNTHCKALDTEEGAGNNSEELLYAEHGPKRLRAVKDDEIMVNDDRNVFRPSESSAFSRYNPSSNANKPSSGNAGSNSLHDNIQDVTKKASVCDCHSNLNDGPPNHYSHVGSSNIDMSSTTENAFTKPGGAPKINPAVSSSVKHSSLKPRDHHAHLVHISHRKLPHCGSSNVYNEAVEGNAVNYSVNGSVSGSNHGSNCPNGSTTAVNVGGVNMECDNNAGASGSGNGTDETMISQREAALTKFREKRKERCFRKKVRYHSRKQLAEQRPRVRGQFVRKSAVAANNDEDTSKAEEEVN